MSARLAAFYFVYYGGVAVQMAFLPSYLLARGLSPRDLGLAQLLNSSLAAVTAVLWGHAADRARHPGVVLRLTTLAVALVYVALSLAPNSASLMVAWAAMGLVSMGVIPLVDAITTHQAGERYGRVRVFGSVGYVVVAQALGWWLTLRGDRADDAVVVGSLVACSAVCTLLTATLVPDRERGRRAPQGPSPRAFTGHVATLVLVSMLHWAANAVYHLYFGAFMRDQGAAPYLTSMALTIGVVVEIVVFATWRTRLSIAQALGLSFVAGVIRWIATPLVPSLVLVVALQALHGLTFGVFWLTVQRALGSWIPAAQRAKGQTVFAALVFGVAHGVGSFVFGSLRESTGSYNAVFAAAALFELLATGLLISRRHSMTTPVL